MSPRKVSSTSSTDSVRSSLLRCVAGVAQGLICPSSPKFVTGPAKTLEIKCEWLKGWLPWWVWAILPTARSGVLFVLGSMYARR